MALLLGTPLAAQGGGQPPNEVLRFDTGFATATLGDLDGVGYGECLIGAPMASPNSIWQCGSAYIYSGMDGGQMARVDGLDCSVIKSAHAPTSPATAKTIF